MLAEALSGSVRTTGALAKTGALELRRWNCGKEECLPRTDAAALKANKLACLSNTSDAFEVGLPSSAFNQFRFVLRFAMVFRRPRTTRLGEHFLVPDSVYLPAVIETLFFSTTNPPASTVQRRVVVSTTYIV